MSKKLAMISLAWRKSWRYKLYHQPRNKIKKDDLNILWIIEYSIYGVT